MSTEYSSNEYCTVIMVIEYANNTVIVTK